MRWRGMKRLMVGLLAAALGAAVLAPDLRAEPSLDDLLDKTRQEADAQKPQAALKALRSAYDKLWEQCPLFLTQALFTKEDAIGYGHYDPRPDTKFSQAEPLYVYLEPAAFGFQFDGFLYRFGFVVDIAVLDASGKERGGAKDFTNFDYVKRTANKEIELNFTIEPLHLPAGNYKLKLTVHDKVKDQSVIKSLPFTIAP
jgi:hypothetical protein